MISHSRIYRARASLATHYYADQANDYYSRDGLCPHLASEGARRVDAVGEVDPLASKSCCKAAEPVWACRVFKWA